jgi:hypothetical protein
VIAESHVVAEMHADHEKTVVANDRRTPLGRAAMNGRVFANPIVIADAHFAPHVWLESEILRSAPTTTPYPIRLRSPMTTCPPMIACA